MIHTRHITPPDRVRCQARVTGGGPWPPLGGEQCRYRGAQVGGDGPRLCAVHQRAAQRGRVFLVGGGSYPSTTAQRGADGAGSEHGG